jgi:hypothetical protein
LVFGWLIFRWFGRVSLGWPNEHAGSRPGFTLRHAAAFVLANKGADTRTLQAYLGHRSIQSTLRYMTAVSLKAHTTLFCDRANWRQSMDRPNITVSTHPSPYGSVDMLGWLIDECGIEPHVTVFHKSARKDSTFSSHDFIHDHGRDIYFCLGGKTLATTGGCSTEPAKRLRGMCSQAQVLSEHPGVESAALNPRGPLVTWRGRLTNGQD